MLCFAIITIGVAVLFAGGLRSLTEAWTQPEYSHGLLIPFIALYLYLRTLLQHPEAAERTRGAGILGVSIVVVGLLGGIVGNLARIDDIATYSLIVLLGGLMIAVAGSLRPAGKWIAIVYLLFMLPLPEFIYWRLSIELQLLSSKIGVGIISLFGVPVYLDGNIIDLGDYQLQVAEACSGLRYLFPLMSLSFFFAVVHRAPLWQRVVIFLAAIPVAILMNAIRIGIIGLMVEPFGVAEAEAFLHAFQGWAIFAVAAALLYGLAIIFNRVDRRQPVQAIPDLDFVASVRQLGRIRFVRAAWPLVACTVLVTAASVAWVAMPAPSGQTPHREPLALLADGVPGWTGAPQSLPPEIERVLDADDYLVSDFSPGGGAGARVNLLIAYYSSQTEAKGFHSPEVCIPAGGWEVAGWTRFDTGLETASGHEFIVNRALIQKGVNQQLVYYWFQQRENTFTSEYLAKFDTLIESVMRGRTDGALVRVVTALEPGESASSADERLRRFLDSARIELPRYVPE